MHSSLVVLVSAAALTLAGCSAGSSEDHAAARPATASPTRSSVPALKASSLTGVKICLEQRRTADVGYWDNTLTASQPLQITGVDAVGSGGRVTGGLLAPVIGGSTEYTGLADWPMKADRLLRKRVEWSARTPLVGAHVPVQRAMLPVLRVQLGPGERVSGIVYRYRTDHGETGALRISLGMRLARAC